MYWTLHQGPKSMGIRHRMCVFLRQRTRSTEIPSLLPPKYEMVWLIGFLLKRHSRVSRKDSIGKLFFATNHKCVGILPCITPTAVNNRKFSLSVSCSHEKIPSSQLLLSNQSHTLREGYCFPDWHSKYESTGWNGRIKENARPILPWTTATMICDIDFCRI